MRSAWRSTHGLPMKARMAIPAQAAPASISTSRRPSESGENVTAEPAYIATSAGARNGVTAMQTSSRASVMAALSPIRAASAGEAKIGGATMLSTSASSSAGDWPRRSMALNASAASTGATSMIQAAAAIRSCGLDQLRTQGAGIDAEKRETQQDEYGFRKERPDQCAERRQEDAKQDRNGDGRGALAAKPGKRRRHAVEQSHRCGITAALAAVDSVA